MWNMNMMDEFSKKWEEMMKEWFDQLMKNPEFLENVSKSMEHAMTSKTVMQDVNKQLAKSMSLPTAQLMGRIGGYILRQEAKISDLEDIILKQNEDIQEIKKLLKAKNK